MEIQRHNTGAEIPDRDRRFRKSNISRRRTGFVPKNKFHKCITDNGVILWLFSYSAFLHVNAGMSFEKMGQM